MKLPLSALLISLACASAAVADEVVLRNGHRVVGIQTEERDRIVVETGYGTVSYPRDEVVSVTKGETPMHAWPVRYAEVEKSKNASDFVKLATWARENRMPRYVGDLMRRAIELEPDNAEARNALGYVRHNGKWVLRSEARQQQGYVQEGGRALNPLEKALAERRRLELESRRLDEASERRQREEKKRRAREEAQLQAGIRSAEAAPTRMDVPWWGYRESFGRWNWYGVDDLVALDWVLSFMNGGGLFPISGRAAVPNSRLVVPSTRPGRLQHDLSPAFP